MALGHRMLLHASADLLIYLDADPRGCSECAHMLDVFAVEVPPCFMLRLGMDQSVMTVPAAAAPGRAVQQHRLDQAIILCT